MSSYSISTEGYRQKFRNLSKLQHQTYAEFAADKLRGLKAWLKYANVDTFDKAINIIALEEFLRKVPNSVKIHIIDREETNLIKAAQLADVFTLIHRSPTRERRIPAGQSTYVKAGSETRDRQAVANNLPKSPVCNFCKKPGHLIKNCPDPRCKVAKTTAQSKPVASTNVMTETPSDPFQPFRSTGTVSIGPGGVEHPVQMIRDTASAQSIILKSVLPNIENYYTGERVFLQDFHSPFPIRLARVHLNSDVVKGEVLVGVSEDPSLPIPHANFLLGNDLAGGRVQGPLITSELHLPYNPTETLEQVQPTLFPDCAVTRAQSKANSRPVSTPTLPPQSDIPSIFSEYNLKEAQRNDPSLPTLHSKALPREDILHSPATYYNDNVLMRMYRPPQLSDNDTWAECHQIVVPVSLRIHIMEIAHEGLAGHLGIKKTYSRLLNEFFWPGMKKDVAEFVKACHTCQVVGKTNETIPPYPLQPIPVPEEPFSKIIIDIVGPLPKTKKGNQYILTTLCPTTRYPEAFALKNISAKNVIKHLIHMFTIYGIPQEIQSDRGSNFTSELFGEILKQLDIKQSLATAYHPQSQGALERLHLTLKNMLRKFCHETTRDWDEGLPFLMFAIRETPTESLGISPFELLYGRRVRGPLKVIKDHLLVAPSSKLVSINLYISSLTEKLKKVRAFAKENLTHAQTVMKKQYDEKSVVREFKEGDMVLAYIPIPGSSLSAKYHGPYKIKKRVSDCNYIIATPDRLKTTQKVHVNLIKAYKSPVSLPDPSRPVSILEHAPVGPLASCGITNVEYRCHPVAQEPELPDLNMDPGTLSANSDILANLQHYLKHLTPKQSQDLITLIHKNSALFTDNPRCCNFTFHDVNLIPGTSPIRQNPYRLSPQKRDLMRKEVDYLLDHGLAVPSQSPWASPCLLVPKEDGKMRMCTDYRRVNSVTIPDAYPLPRIDDLIDEVGQAKYITKMDLLRGYYQIPLTPNAQLVSAFSTPFGLYEYKVMPFGMRNSPATFQRAMNYLLQDLKEVSVYLDDILIYSLSWQQHIQQLSAVMSRLHDASLTVKLAKTNFWPGYGDVSGACGWSRQHPSQGSQHYSHC